MVAFLREVFGATGEVKTGAPSEISGRGLYPDDQRRRRSARALLRLLYVYVENSDRIYARAVKAGATVIDEPTDTPWGDRRSTVRDPWGNTWQIATRKG